MFTTECRLNTTWTTKVESDARGVCYHELDRYGQLLEVNQAWLELVKQSKENVLGRFASEFIATDSLQNIEKHFHILKAYGEVNHVRLQFVDADEQVHDVLLFGHSEYDRQGDFVKAHCWFAPLSFFLQDESCFLAFLQRLEDIHENFRKQKNYLDRVINSVSSYVLIVQNGHIQRANKPFLDFFDCQTVAELSLKLSATFKQKLFTLIENDFHKPLLVGDPCFELQHPLTQEIHYFDCQVNPIALTQKESVVVFNNITQALALKNALDYEKTLSQKYLNLAKVMVLALDVDANITLINEEACRVLEYRKEELLGCNWFEKVIVAEEATALNTYFKQLLLGDEDIPEFNENEVVTKSGARRLVFWRNVVLRDDENHIIGTLSSAEDITEIRASQQQLEFLAHHDVLTGLDNRKSLELRLNQSIKTAQRHNTLFAVCFIDLDNFKIINDSYGHKTGDALLLVVAARIKNAIRETDTLARFGGDEFVVLMEDMHTETEIALTTRKLLALFNEPFSFSGNSMMITMSMGVSVFPNDADNSETLLQNADIAMYEAKRLGKNQLALYNQNMALKIAQRATLQQELSDAILKKQFMVYYQPQLDQVSRKVVGIEALVRWQHPTKGVVLPDEFIPLAEEAGLIIPMGEQVLQQACLDITHLHHEGLFDGYVSVNISGVQIESGQFFSMVERVLHETDTKPSLVEMEITESVVMTHPEQWIALFKNLKSIGLKIAIDDFGTGYSSLSQLSKMPLDKIKIDKSFIRDLPQDEKARSVVQAIINLSSSMNMVSIAEGIENQAQHTFLSQQNCGIGQGFLFARPMPLASLKDWLLNHQKQCA